MNLDLLKSHPYISQDIKIEKFNDPYSYIVIDNLFKEDIYQAICDKFHTYISRCPGSFGEVGETGLTYDAFIYGVHKEDCTTGYDFFISKLWKTFLSNALDVELNKYMAYSLHFHKGSKEKPSKNGWPHLDLNICAHIENDQDEIHIVDDCNYADDTCNLQPNTKKIVRSIAMLYYFNNKKDLEEGDGGGTGLFKNSKLESLVKEVKPINNRLFAFEVSPKSHHAFIGAKFDRSAMVNWFHSSPSYIVNKKLDLYKERYAQTNQVFEYWTKNNRWTLDKDLDYFKFFDKPYDELFKK